MAYDPVKAHEYYVKYRKKGIKKGRKKGKKSTSSLVGTSTAGLNADGRVEAALIKDRLKKEMNSALAKAKTDAEKEQIRREFSKKANAEIAKLKADPKFAKAKASKASKGSSSNTSKASKGSSSNTSKSSVTAKSTTTSTSTSDAKALEEVKNITNQVNEIYSKLKDMTPEQKIQARQTVSNIVALLRKRLKG